MAKFLQLFGAYFKANMAIALEYRASFISQVFGMFINDMIWVAFWVLYFTRFPVLKGWTLDDVIVLWASLAFSFGLVSGILGNARRIPQMVVTGQLDYYLALPKNVLWHLLIAQIRPIALGDAIFGPVLLVVMVELTWAKVAVFLATALVASCVWLGIMLIGGSLAFYMGNAEVVNNQIFNGVIHFSSYPITIFDGSVKVLLYTLLPAGFITGLPVELMRQWSWLRFGQQALAGAFFLGLGILLFNGGLRRYESGNLMMMRS